jgi:hypothetical protein
LGQSASVNSVKQKNLSTGAWTGQISLICLDKSRFWRNQ